MVAMATVVLGGGVGTVLGIIAGYRGGRVDAIIMRAVDATISIPMILLALLFAVLYGPSLLNIIIVLSLLIWARYARLIRGEVLSVKNRDYVDLARVAGASSIRIIIKHIFPNLVNTLVVYTTLEIGWVILTEAALSFLGAGIPPPAPAWGSMVAEGRDVIIDAWWVCVVPGIAILATVLSLNLFGDWLRDTLDPRLRHV
jgi:peptide/nickel transport system permease protein